MRLPEDLRYAETHEWVRVEADGTMTVGISDFAQDALGDIVYIELPEVGTALTKGEPMGEVESTKSVNEIYAPVDGEVVEANTALDDQPELINSDPYGAGWIAKIRPAEGSGVDGMLDAEAYAAANEG